MKIELCVYSGYKIYPGHGRTLVKADGKSYKFLSGRTHKAHMLKRNPREVTWTVLYRRKHKKGLEEETAKKRNKRTQKFQRAVVGATLQVNSWTVRYDRHCFFFRILWPSVTRNPKFVRPRESKLLELPRSRRRPPPRSLQPRTIRHRRLSRRPLRMSPSLPPGLGESDECNIGC